MDTTTRHKAAAGRHEVIDGSVVVWCAYCRHNVVRRPMRRLWGKGRVHSMNVGTNAHGNLVR
jgi:hypothetical protein